MKLIYTLRSDWNSYLYKYNLEDNNKNLITKIGILFHNPNMFFILAFRIENALVTNKFLLIRMIGWSMYPFYYYLGYFIFDIIVSPKVRIGAGLYIHYKNVVIANTVSAGKNLSIIGPVTIGTSLTNGKSAKIGNNVTICTGARVIGNIVVGNNVIIGANAVVVKNVNNNCVVAGIPAKLIRNTKAK